MRTTLLKSLVIFFCCIGSIKAENTKSFSFCFEIWRPFSYVNENGLADGQHIIMLKRAVDSLNYQSTFVELPFKRCLKKVQLGDIDFAIHVDETDGVKLIDYPMGSWDLFFAYGNKQKAAQPFNRNNEQSKILIAHDYVYPEKVIDILNSMSVEILTESFYTCTESEVKNLFKLVESGMVDAILVDKSWAQYELSKQNINVVLGDTLLYSQLQFIGYIESNTENATALLQALKNIDKNGKKAY
jgi:ABC-type amino acid transport substrate-binding protein